MLNLNTFKLGNDRGMIISCSTTETENTPNKIATSRPAAAATITIDCPLTFLYSSPTLLFSSLTLQLVLGNSLLLNNPRKYVMDDVKTSAARFF